MELERSSGILLHITSLPSRYGIGDFGPEAYKFIDFLVETKQKLWQILPLTTISCPSPYSSLSSFGGNSWLISPDKLFEENLLSENDINNIDQYKFSDLYVNFNHIKQFKENLFQISFQNFKNKNKNFKEILENFYQNEIYWIDDFILFMTIKDKSNEDKWSNWPDELRRRDSLALENIRQNEKDLFEYHLFIQYIFNKQWNQLKKYANNLNIKIIGDMNMYLEYNSVDVWSNNNLFQLDSNTLKPTVISGFPASDQYDVQIWNQPIYNWNNENVKDKLFNWWNKRLKKLLTTVDIIRIDHFRGFQSHYVIPIDNNTQKPQTSKGHWIKTPGYELFTEITNCFGCDVPLIVEDIGDVTIEVFKLRDHFKFYGIRILQMGFYTYPDNIYSPHNYITNSIAYTGTHDNPTASEWWNKLATKDIKDKFIEYIRRPFIFNNEEINGLEFEKHLSKYICWYLIQILLQSSSNGAIILMQDLLNVETRMNYPGTETSMENNEGGNWSWRFQWSQLTSNIISELKRLTIIYGRDLKYGKSIPPEDMIMKNDQSFYFK